MASRAGHAAGASRSNIALLEHVNLYVANREHAETFYCDVLGFVPDPRAAGVRDLIHVNMGLSQLHLPIAGRRGHYATQAVRGVLELMYPPDELDAVRARAERACGSGGALRAAGASCARVSATRLDATCPWGNVYRCVSSPAAAGLTALQERIGAHPGGASRGVCLSKVEVLCPVGSAPAIARFYTEVLGAAATADAGTATIDCGGVTALSYVESASFRELMGWSRGVGGDQWHIALYLRDFEGAYRRVTAAGLQWDNPRVRDYARTLDEALAREQFRFKDIRDMESGAAIMEIEHEVRSLRHKNCPLGRTKAEADAAASVSFRAPPAGRL